MSQRWDVVVVGGGVMGTSAARTLAARGRAVLVLERFSIGHTRGSSGGPTRIVRLTYDDPRYVRLARRAFEAWDELQSATGTELLQRTGGLDIGPHAERAADALAAAGETLDRLSVGEIAERWPSLRFSDGITAIHQADTSIASAERTMHTQAQEARRLGAEIREHTVVESIRTGTGGAEVVAGGEAVHAPAVVVTAGAWTAPLLDPIGISLDLRPTREQVAYFSSDPAAALPAVIDWTPSRTRVPYLVPDPWSPGAFKVGHHRSGPDTDPDQEGTVDAGMHEAALRWASEHVAGETPAGAPETCLYTNAPDEDFVLDRLGPLVIASPCSGHGFKFAPLFGAVIADLATGETPSVDVSPFRTDRPALAVG